MIKLQDFARAQGVTDRQIQRLIKKYATEIEGKYERKGPNGTWLSDEACDFLRSKMKAQPIALYDDAKDKKIQELEASKKELQDDNERLRKERDKAQDDLFVAKQVITELQKQEVLYLEEKNKVEVLEKQLEEERNKKWYQKIFKKQ